jgi:hypothetical protein
MSGEEAVVALFVFGGGFWVLRPLAGALARRIGGEVPPRQATELDEAVLGELHQLRQDVNDLAERVDFAERLLAKQKETGRLAPPGS